MCEFNRYPQQGEYRAEEFTNRFSKKKLLYLLRLLDKGTVPNIHKREWEMVCQITNLSGRSRVSLNYSFESIGKDIDAFDISKAKLLNRILNKVEMNSVR